MFRSDINLLRAISVIGVVFYHFEAYFITGGFIGVDVFFVISGFLMTKIVHTRLEENNFSYFSFFKRRCERIIPPLACMILVFLIINWFFSYSIYYREQGKHGLASLGFLSNLIYWQESNYFDSASKGKLFLHTWSLSVEWQFYLLYPLILMFSKRIFSLSSNRYIVAFISVVSFSLCIWGSSRYPSATFYLLPTRSWEMTLGGMAFLYSCDLRLQARKFVSICGLSVILFSMFFFDESDLWPSYYSLIPTISAALVIWSQYESRFFRLKILVWIGLSSYSIYLWHWPFLAMRFNGFIDANNILLFVFLALVSWLSYYFLERKR